MQSVGAVTIRNVIPWCLFFMLRSVPQHCPSSVDFDACFATCQCYDAADNPTHTHDALCILDECFCVFDACPYGR